MKKAILTLVTLVTLGASAFAGDIWWVNPGACACTDFYALKALFNTPRHTTAYRVLRNALLMQGVLVPVSGRVEVIQYLPDSAELLGQDGNIYYLPIEDFAYKIGVAVPRNNWANLSN